MAIYAWILFNLWKHDKDIHENGIITEPMKKERNQKNVITLYGQVATFVVETAISILILVHLSKSTAEVSFLPISQVVGSTTISIIQLASFNLDNIFAFQLTKIQKLLEFYLISILF